MQGNMVAQMPALWQEYTRTRSSETRRRLVLQYLDLVRYVVSKFGMHSQGRDHGLEVNDIVQYGILGLVDAIDRFSPGVGVKFETYAVPRIRGAILDELRSLDWLPRSVRANHRRIERAVHQASQENGREAIDTEIAGKLEMTLDEFRAFVAECSGPTAARHGSQRKESPAETLEAIPAHTANPFEKLSDDESKEFLVQAVSQLPTRERSIIALYYYEGLKFGEIGSILHISESRVSQIHAEVLRDLRQKLNSLQ